MNPIKVKRSLDFQAGNSRLNEVLFDVERLPLFVEIESTDFKNQTRDMFRIISEKIKISANGYQAIVNKQTKLVLGVVSDKYRLITNTEALKLGKEIYGKVFGISLDDLKVLKVITSQRKTFCHIDLVHPNATFNVFKNDKWLPFIRVTNSYNKTFALSYELGFVRNFCVNGFIFDKKTIVVKVSHNKGIENIKYDLDLKHFDKAKTSFISHMFSLKKFHIPKTKHFPLVCKCLGIKNPDLMDNADDSDVNKFKSLKSYTEALAETYCGLEGETAYSLFNVITDLVSHQEEYNNIPNYNLRPNSYAFKPTLWIEEFVTEIEKRDFNLETYLGEFNNY